MILGIVLAGIAVMLGLMAAYGLYLDAHEWRAIGWSEDEGDPE